MGISVEICVGLQWFWVPVALVLGMEFLELCGSWPRQWVFEVWIYFPLFWLLIFRVGALMGEFWLLEPIGDYAVLMFWWLANISAKVCNIFWRWFGWCIHCHGWILRADFGIPLCCDRLCWSGGFVVCCIVNWLNNVCIELELCSWEHEKEVMLSSIVKMKILDWKRNCKMGKCEKNEHKEQRV
jgi:hypothetical protein